MSFGSDNHSGVHPQILAALTDANQGHQIAYGSDEITNRVTQKLNALFGESAQSYFVLTGTGANVLSIKEICRSHHSVISSEFAHLFCDESGAPEHFTGCKVLPIPTEKGKLTVSGIKTQLTRVGDHHSSQPRLISITQCSELGTVYTPDEVRKISQFAKANNLYLHMDGARLANAAAFLGCQWRDITTDCGVDILSFGGTKNGMMLGEAVVILNPTFGAEFAWIRKQGMQLASKMRFISAQFEAYLADELWRSNASHANSMAKYLSEAAATFEGISIAYPVQANEIFATVPAKVISDLAKKWKFYVWEPELNMVRWVTSWDTTKEEIDQFLADMRRSLESQA